MVRQTNTVTVSNPKKYWYTLAGYLALGILGVLYVASTAMGTSGEFGTAVTGSSAAMVIFLLSVLGLGTYPALFKDSTSLRGGRGGWSPQWWYYIGAGFGLPVVIYFAMNALGDGLIGGVIAIFLHAVSATVMSGVYLYRRHKYIGVP